jgi:hypothetical protein
MQCAAVSMIDRQSLVCRLLRAHVHTNTTQSVPKSTRRGPVNQPPQLHDNNPATTHEQKPPPHGRPPHPPTLAAHPCTYLRARTAVVPVMDIPPPLCSTGTSQRRRTLYELAIQRVTAGRSECRYSCTVQLSLSERSRLMWQNQANGQTHSKRMEAC